MADARARGISCLAIGLMYCALAGCGGEPEPEFGRMYIEARVDGDSIDGATVYLNGEYKGETPLNVPQLPTGNYVVRIDYEGYRAQPDFITVAEDEEAISIIELRPIRAFLSVDSEPPLAEVMLNEDTLLGETPIGRKPIPIGENTVTVRMDNFETITETIDAEPDYHYTKEYKLVPMQAELTIRSTPTLSNIWLNQQTLQERTPATLPLDPGTYRVAVHQEGYIMSDQVVQLAPNEKAEIELSLEEGWAPPGMILVPAGEFTMGVAKGAPDERPKQTIFVDDFYIDRYEVTNAQFAQVFPNHAFEPEFANHPVTGVSFDLAQQYAEAIGKRLPTEAEWEKAARGTGEREWPWGNAFDPDLCNSAVPVERGMQPVGQYIAGASPYGVLDMAGNAMEWTATWYGPYPGNEEISENYGQIYRVMRGGSFKSSRFDVRAPRRHYARPETVRDDVGFRCAADPPEEQPARARR